MTPSEYATSLRDAIRTLDGKNDRLQQANDDLTRRLILAELRATVAEDMCDALRVQVNARDLLISCMKEQAEDEAGVANGLELTTMPAQHSWLDNTAGRSDPRLN